MLIEAVYNRKKKTRLLADTAGSAAGPPVSVDAGRSNGGATATGSRGSEDIRIGCRRERWVGG
jgi:hypothetical protein